MEQIIVGCTLLITAEMMVGRDEFGGAVFSAFCGFVLISVGFLAS